MGSVRGRLPRGPALRGLPPIVDDVVSSPGRPLDERVRAQLEPRFGHDLSRIRVHADTNAATSALAVDALAYTVGHDVVFGHGAYAPSTTKGRQLIAHEVAHVLQQTTEDRAQGASMAASAEREAVTLSRAAVTGANAPVARHVAFGTLQRAVPAVGALVLLKACAVGAIAGALIDLGFQTATNLWRRLRKRKARLIDYCTVILSAVLSCVGGAVAKRWLEPYINRQLGPTLAGVAGPLLGRIIVWLAVRAGIGVPNWVLKRLLSLGCITTDQAVMVGSARSGPIGPDADDPEVAA